MTLQFANPRKTREEVEALKQGWRNDPCFDLEDTEGFEEYHDELLAYRNQVEAERKQKYERLIAAFDQPRSAGEIRYELAAATDTTISILVEIAAQLAEANKLKRLEVEAINNLGGAVNLLTHEGSPLGKLAGSAESIAVNLDILVNRGRV